MTGQQTGGKWYLSKGAYGEPCPDAASALSRHDLIRQRQTGQHVARLLWRVRQTLLCRTSFSGTLTREIAEAIEAAHTQGLLP